MSEPEPDPFERFRTAVLDEPRLQAQLGAADDWPAFIEAAAAAAQRLGLELGPQDFARRQHADPLGLLRFEPPPAAPPATPQPGWLPAQLVWDGGALAVDWAYFGARRLASPLYEGDLRAALARPFNILLRFRTPLGEFGRWARALPRLRPRGLIFHMSRSGSTLVSQMLAASPANLVISEAAPIDAILQTGGLAQVALLGDMVDAFGQVRNDEQRNFVKLEPWHIFAMPAFRAAFPDTPWVFLYRDPVEVMVSQLRQRTTQLAPPPLLATLCGPGAPGMRDDEQCARVLGAVCRAALEADAGGGGLLVNYDDLPHALWSRILPHFGVEPADGERAAMAAAARFDAKAPWLEFSADGADKRGAADERVRTLCAEHLDDVYRSMQARRQGD